jgi:hypothetical protein
MNGECVFEITQLPLRLVRAAERGCGNPYSSIIARLAKSNILAKTNNNRAGRFCKEVLEEFSKIFCGALYLAAFRQIG